MINSSLVVRETEAKAAKGVEALQSMNEKVLALVKASSERARDSSSGGPSTTVTISAAGLRMLESFGQGADGYNPQEAAASHKAAFTSGSGPMEPMKAPKF